MDGVLSIEFNHIIMSCSFWIKVDSNKQWLYAQGIPI